MSSTTERGQGMTEYLIVLLGAIVILSVPWGGNPAPMQQFLTAVTTYYKSYSYELSLP